MKSISTIVNIATALSKSYGADITELNIKYNEYDITQAELHLAGHYDYVFKITGDGEVTILSEEKATPDFIEELDVKEDFEAKRKKAIDKILRENEEARLKISEEMSNQTAAEAMASMKVAVDNLDIPKKPKRSESGWSGARPKDRHEKILKLYNEGWTKVKMAEELGIGISTVNYHIQKLRDEGKI